MESFKIRGNAPVHSLGKNLKFFIIPAKLIKYKYIYNIVKETVTLNINSGIHLT